MKSASRWPLHPEPQEGEALSSWLRRVAGCYDIDARELGFEVQVFAMVRLVSQSERDLTAFENRARDWALVRECHMLNGEIDFILKCVSPDLSTFQRFLTQSLTAAPNVASVKTSLVIRAAKDQPGVPFEIVEERVRERPVDWFWVHKRWPDKVYAALDRPSAERLKGPA